jgi:hypothetical protein
MANISSSSFLSFEDSEYDGSFIHDDFVESEVFGISFEDYIETESVTDEAADEVARIRSSSDIWRYFT